MPRFVRWAMYKSSIVTNGLFLKAFSRQYKGMGPLRHSPLEAALYFKVLFPVFLGSMVQLRFGTIYKERQHLHGHAAKRQV